MPMFAFVYSHNPAILTPEQRLIAENLVDLGGDRNALLSAGRRAGSGAPGTAGRRGEGGGATASGGPTASPDVPRAATTTAAQPPSTDGGTANLRSVHARSAHPGSCRSSCTEGAGHTDAHSLGTTAGAQSTAGVDSSDARATKYGWQ